MWICRWRQWGKKCKDDSETCNWLTANTKSCPKCSNPVEKNGGCNLVLCRCGQAFCWLCGGVTGTDHSWTQIYGHECGRWKDDLDKRIDAAQRNHKRYMFYFERWKGHRDSLEKEGDHRWCKLTLGFSPGLLHLLSGCESNSTRPRHIHLIWIPICSWVFAVIDELGNSEDSSTW